MTSAELDILMQRIEAGRLDDLSPEQIDALASALDESPRLDARLAKVTTPPANAFTTHSIAMPTAAEWSRMYVQIDERSSAARRAPWGVFRSFRVAAPFAAAAVCVLAVSLFSSLSHPALADVIALDADVQIESVEVGEGDSTIVVNSGDDDHFAVIWVVDDGPSSEEPATVETSGPVVGAPE